MNWQTAVTRDLGWHFKSLQQISINVVTRNHEVNRQIFYGARFSLQWQKQLYS